jgi:pimeloyl-ACP methyl ester carboxylesterase
VTPPAEAYGPGPDRFGELWRPAGSGPWPVVALLHGGFWRTGRTLELMRPLAADLAGRGFAAWNLEYRRVGQPGGGWPGTCEDVAAGLDHLEGLASRAPLDLDRLVVAGHSAGGHLALWSAARRPRGGAAGHPLAGGEPGRGLRPARRGRRRHRRGRRRRLPRRHPQPGPRALPACLAAGPPAPRGPPAARPRRRRHPRPGGAEPRPRRGRGRRRRPRRAGRAGRGRGSRGRRRPGPGRAASGPGRRGRRRRRRRRRRRS